VLTFVSFRGVYFFLLLGVAACSTAVIWVRLSEVPPLLLCGWRLVLSTMLLLPLAVKAWQSASPEQRAHAIWGTALPGLALALHLVSWTWGARLTEAARATLIVNMTPLALPFMLWLMNRERINRGEWLGTVVALVGVFLLTGPFLSSGWVVKSGDWICLGSMVLMGVYLVLGRRNRGRGAFWLYLVPVYAWAGLACLFLALPFHSREMIPEWSEWGWLLVLATIPTILGHGLINYALRQIGTQQVGVLNQTQFLFASVAAFFIFGETPAWFFYPAAALIVLGSWLVIKAMPEQT
jgi:drug/metabolite transporter (DMT)-like permease